MGMYRKLFLNYEHAFLEVLELNREMPSSTDENIHELLPLQQQPRAPHLLTLGKPWRKQIFTTSDIITTILCLSFFIIGLSCIQNTHLAAQLGQKNQLIVVGFLLSLMALLTSRHIQFLLVAIEAGSGKTTLQNMDAILNSNVLARQTRTRYRIALLIWLATPLALSAGYRSFQGGQSTTGQLISVGEYGITGPPGTQDLGWGLSLFVNVTLPWFEDPGFDRVYGFNMFVVSENTTAILDGPLPAYVKALQSHLHSDESRSITAEVNATVSDLYNGLSESKEVLNSTFASSGSQQSIGTNDWWCGVLGYSVSNISIMWISWWGLPLNQTFISQVQEYKITRQKFNATWTITPNSVSVKEVIVPPQPVLGSQAVIQINILAVQYLYIGPITEYDYIFRDTRLKYTNNTKYHDFVKSDSSLASAMVWSRIVALGGPETGNTQPDLLYNATSTTQLTRTTLRKDWALILILAINPLLLLASVALRVLVFGRVPVSEGFGLVSVLAGAEKSTLGMLEGAGLSGRLAKEVEMRFRVQNDEGELMQKSGQVKIIFGEGGKSNNLRTGYTYG